MPHRHRDFPDGRHDAKRGLDGALERAWSAVDQLRAAAPYGGRQVQVVSVLMESNWQDVERVLQATGARGVGHMVTLLSTTVMVKATAPMPVVTPQPM